MQPRGCHLSWGHHEHPRAGGSTPSLPSRHGSRTEAMQTHVEEPQILLITLQVLSQGQDQCSTAPQCCCRLLLLGVW